MGIALVMAMRLPRRAPVTSPMAMMAALREGMGWLWQNVMLRRLGFILGGFNFLGYGVWAIFVLYAQRVLGLDAVGYGLFLTLAACGGLAATLIGPRILRHISPTAAILIGMAVFTATAAVMALRPPAYVVGAVMMIDGFAGMLWNIAQVSYRQRHIPADLLGRVNSAFRFIGTGPAFFGALSFGALIAAGESLVGAETAVLLPYAVSAVLGAVLTGYALLRLRLE
jgi:MFS-type transporter involved in bile tolerance (Atg22 family)